MQPTRSAQSPLFARRLQAPRHTAKLGFCLLLLTLSSCAQGISWQQEYQMTLEEAREKNRPILFDFSRPNCVWCQKLEAITFRDPEVAELLNEQFVMVKVDASKNPNLAKAFGVESFPTMVVVSPEGQAVFKHAGFMDADQCQRTLERVLNDSFMGH